MQGRLILCDIDGTLVDTAGAGLEALRGAARELFGGEGPPLNLCGATDGGIVRDYLAFFEEPYEEARVEEFYSTYLRHLDEQLSSGSFAGRVLPGVVSLLNGLSERGATLGLLTGNIARGAAAKVAHYGLAEYFDFGAYGDDHHDRNQLGPVALRRAEEGTGITFFSSGTIVLGDTPKDIACAKHINAIAVCVATGSFGVEKLKEEGADLVFSSFENHDQCIEEMGRLFEDSVI